MIDKILDRKNELIRPDIANVDQILLVFAAKEPDFSFYLLDLFIAVFILGMLVREIDHEFHDLEVSHLSDLKDYEYND